MLSRAIVLIAAFGAVSNYTMLRRPLTATDDDPIGRPKSAQSSLHLWSNIPILPPHTGHKKVLVTGAAGFIGSHVAEALLGRGDEVIVVDDMNDYYDVSIKEGNLNLLRDKAKKMAHQQANKTAEDILKIYRGDVNNETIMRSIFDQHKPRWICHMAARAGVRPSIDDPLLYAKANVLGTVSMLEYSRKYNATNVVISSSSSVYGESESTYFSEAEDVNKPVSPYAATKRSGELISFTYHKLYDLKVTNLRFFTVYGPRGRPDMAPYKFISQVTRGDEIEQYGDGTTSRDYTYVDDIVDGVIRAIDRPYPYEIINLGKGSGTKLNEFILLVEKYVGKKANIKLMPAQPGDVPFTNADISKANKLLGYSPKVPIEEGVRRTVAWFKETYTEDGIGEENESQ
jgi:UDP-glucuronate 4-epimerase